MVRHMRCVLCSGDANVISRILPMVNPFEKRATEYFRDDEAFLAVVTPEPLATYFENPACEERLFDRLAIIIGTPGSGKTTLSRLFQFQTLMTLLRNHNFANLRPLVDSLVRCDAIHDGHPTLIGGRIPLETEYRDIWELPYSDQLRAGLMGGLLQARTVLEWFRNIEAAGISTDDVEVIPRTDASAALASIGGRSAKELIQKARLVESAIYEISAALLAPDEKSFDPNATMAYRPFDVISLFRVTHGETVHEYRPLIVFDDAHCLHPDQLNYLRRWLAGRELRVARWILMRLDSLTPAEVLSDRIGRTEYTGLDNAREITVINMQDTDDRKSNRRAFRKMAKDMSSRYLNQMSVFHRRGLHNLGDLLSTAPQEISPSDMNHLKERVNKQQSSIGISVRRRRELESKILDYTSLNSMDGEDTRLSMLGLLFERYGKRTPHRDLFTDIGEDPEPNRPLKVDSSIVDGARIHLFHRYNRPYFYGIDTLCDASSENAEQFLRLTSSIVSRLETRLVLGGDATLSSRDQHKILLERATEVVESWDFPESDSVRSIAERIARQCIEKSIEPSAPLGGGANAIGIIQEEFDTIPHRFPALARVLQFGVANNAFVLVRNHRTKNRVWCLIELGGVLLLRHGLTLKRGGFLERCTDDLILLME